MKGGICIMKGDMHGEGGMHGKGGHVWQRGTCVVKGGCGEGGGGMHGKGGHGKGGVYGERGVYMAGCVCVWQERWPLQQTVRILLEFTLVLYYCLMALPSIPPPKKK